MKEAEGFREEEGQMSPSPAALKRTETHMSTASHSENPWFLASTPAIFQEWSLLIFLTARKECLPMGACLGAYPLLVYVCQEDAVVAVHILLEGVMPVLGLHQPEEEKK